MSKEIWTKLQYSNEIMSNYINILKEIKNKHPEVHLVGYSGGSVIAMYLASIKELNIQVS
jgi:alpha/beta superfamily hydrolase